MQLRNGGGRCQCVVLALGWMLASMPLIAVQYSVLSSFNGGVIEGGLPYGALTLSGGKLYGVTYQGGVSNCGVLFMVNTNGSGFTRIHSFAGYPSDGAKPHGSLMLSGSMLYGTTVEGGSNYFGTVFALNLSNGGYTILHNFASGNNDGAAPGGSLTLSGSTLYGMTENGGISNAGTVFQLNTSGTGFAILWNFGYFGTKAEPTGSLALSGSTLYGMTPMGGFYNYGVVIKYLNMTNGLVYNNLHDFTHIPDGSAPVGSLTLSGATLYGMTPQGGSNNIGTVFKVDTNGNGYAILHHFGSGLNDGSTPNGSLVISGTTLYGMTYLGGNFNQGTVFQINTNGTGYTILHHFTSGSDGAWPQGSLTLAGSTLYGMTTFGGISNAGTIFALSTSARFYLQDTAGNVTRWVVNSTGTLQQVDTLASMGSWKLKAVGDLNGDGQTDLFWQQSSGSAVAWLSQTNTKYQGLGLGNMGAWALGAVADVDGDGVPDLIWQHPSGCVVIWYMNANGTSRGSASLGNMGVWALKGSGDLNGDGKADLIWQSPMGDVVAWLSQAGSGYQGLGVGNLGAWALCAMADVDGDGIPDLIWQNPGGWVVVWYMNANGTVRTGVGLGNVGTAKIMAVD